ncbi:hypothetical protein Goarm_018539 [Gossypium armourianum]|uniref:Uncharacterized protein n=1 Tax=Gossypium armourianum TaxID=34283 RepID=A0A7J9IHU3_9ROSI|nr:hypothetical protein [Gossypium armourianum]
MTSCFAIACILLGKLSLLFNIAY